MPGGAAALHDVLNMWLTRLNSIDPFPKFSQKLLSILPKQVLQFDEDLEAMLEKSSGFAILMQSFCPTLTKRYHRQPDQQEDTFSLYLLSQPHQETIVHVHKDQLTIYGQAEPLISNLQECLQAYHYLGEPQIEDYSLSLTKASMKINRNGLEFPLS